MYLVPAVHRFPYGEEGRTLAEGLLVPFLLLHCFLSAAIRSPRGGKRKGEPALFPFNLSSSCGRAEEEPRAGGGDGRAGRPQK